MIFTLLGPETSNVLIINAKTCHVVDDDDDDDDNNYNNNNNNNNGLGRLTCSDLQIRLTNLYIPLAADLPLFFP
jgi:hypothetical protein